MAVSGIDSLFGSRELTEIERLRREREAGGALGHMSGGSDTVTISDEGKRLAAEMQARKAEEQEAREKQGSAQDSFAAASTGISEEEAEQTEAAGNAGGVGGSSEASQVDRIKKQIEQLEAKMQSVASGGLPENIKASAIATYQAQIAELQSQLQQAQRG